MLSYIEISKSNLLHNFTVFRKYIHTDAKIVSVVKANAYGHGLAQVTQMLEPHTDYFQVDDIEELRVVRKYTGKPVLVLGYAAKDELEEAIHLNATLTLYDTERLEKLERIAQKTNQEIKVHIKIDAGLGRQGILVTDLEPFLQKLKNYPKIKVEGVYGHFANIEDIGDPSYGTLEFSHAQKQIELLKNAVELFNSFGYTNILTHISSTAGTFVYEKAHLHNPLVRIGIGQYGLWPSSNIKRVLQKQGVILKPIMKWVTHIAQIKTVPANYTIGYGLTHITYQETKIAVIPQGYSDGYDRGLSNRGEVLVRGERCKVLGRIAMNMFVVDVTHITGVQQEDEVVLLGRQDEQEITAEELADHIDTINYEVVARVSPALERIIVQ